MVDLMPSAPVRSPEQRASALAHANAIRSARAQWKRDVRTRQADPVAVVLDPPAEFESMRVLEVLLAMPKVGRVKADVMLRRAGVSPSKRLGGLTVRQRAQLVALLPSGRRGTVR